MRYTTFVLFFIGRYHVNNIIGCYLTIGPITNTLMDQLQVQPILNWASSSAFVMHIQYVHMK